MFQTTELVTRYTNAKVVLVGEAGVGKTRLVEESAERAREDGARVLTGIGSVSLALS